MQIRRGGSSADRCSCQAAQRVLIEKSWEKGVHLLHPATIDAAIAEQSCGPDAILPFPTRFGLGFMLPTQERPFGPHPRAFGHPGRGGSIGFADLDGRIGFGYVMNQYQTGTLRNPDLRWPTLVQAVYASLGAQ